MSSSLLVLAFLTSGQVLGAVDRGLGTFEDDRCTLDSAYFRTGSIVYFRSLGTIDATRKPEVADKIPPAERSRIEERCVKLESAPPG